MKVTFLVADAFGTAGEGQAWGLAASLSRMRGVDVAVVSLVRAAGAVPRIPAAARLGYLLDLRDPATARRVSRSGASTLVPGQVPEFREFSQESDQALAALAQHTDADVVVVDGLGLSIALTRCALSAPVVALVSQSPRIVPPPVLAQLAGSAERIRAVACTVADRAWRDALGGAMEVWPTPWVVPDPGPLRADPSAPGVVAVGPFGADSGVYGLIDAFALVAGERPDWDLVLCASGPRAPVLAARALERGVADRVTVTGRGENLLEELVCASVLVSPADRDSDGAVVAAAMRVGVAVVCAERPERPRGLVHDGRSGLVVPVGDVPALASALASVIDDVSLRERLVEQGARRGEQASDTVVAARFLQRLGGITRLRGGLGDRSRPGQVARSRRRGASRSQR